MFLNRYNLKRTHAQTHTQNAYSYIMFQQFTIDKYTKWIEVRYLILEVSG